MVRVSKFVAARRVDQHARRMRYPDEFALRFDNYMNQ